MLALNIKHLCSVYTRGILLLVHVILKQNTDYSSRRGQGIREAVKSKHMFSVSCLVGISNQLTVSLSLTPYTSSANVTVLMSRDRSCNYDNARVSESGAKCRAGEHPDTATVWFSSLRLTPWRTASLTSPAVLSAHSDTINSYKTGSQIIYFILLHNRDVANIPGINVPCDFHS